MVRVSGEPLPSSGDGTVCWLTTAGQYSISQLWKSDGTTAGTRMVKNFDNNASGGYYNTARIASIGGKLFLSMDHNRLWVSDGTVNGTVQIKTFTPTDPANPRPITNFTDRGGVAYFQADDAADGQGYGWWRSDGTAAGTVRVRPQDIPPVPFDVNGMTFAAWGGPTDVQDVELYRLGEPAEAAPAAPTSLTATAVSPRQIDLAWMGT